MLSIYCAIVGEDRYIKSVLALSTIYVSTILSYGARTDFLEIR